MFENPVDTTIVSDTLPFLLQRDSVVQASDSLRFDFSGRETIATDSSQTFFQNDSTTLLSSKPFNGFPGIPIAQPQFQESIIFLLFALCFALFSVVFRREGQALKGNFRNLLSFRSRDKAVFKEQITISEMWGEFFLLFQTVLIISLVFFIYLWSDITGRLSLQNQLLSFLFIFFSIVLFFAVKYATHHIIDYILPELELEEWNDKYVWLIEVFGIACFLPALIFIFLQDVSIFALILLFINFFISASFIFGSLLRIFVKNKIGFLYFIVYLCAVEIAPYFMIYKGANLFINYVGRFL